MNHIYFGDNLQILREMPSESVDLIYIDPPFNTKKIQKRTTIKTIKDENGDRKGFKGNTYRTVELGTKSYQDKFDSYIDGFLRPRLKEAYRILKSYGSLYFHIDYREVHYCKILLDNIFGKECFLNEIIWAYDYGGRARSKWPAKHDNILFYVKDPKNYIFNIQEVDREDYMAPGLVGPEKAERGKSPTDTWWWTYVNLVDGEGWDYDPTSSRFKLTDTWWHTIVGTNSKERVGYPTQKPQKIIDRIIKASSVPGSLVLDFFAGSGTVGKSCLEVDRKFILIDNNPLALEVMAESFAGKSEIEWHNFDPTPFSLGKKTENSSPQKKRKIEFSPDFVRLAAASSSFHRDDELLIEQSELWKNSPFEWVVQLSAAKKGALAKHLVTSWCSGKGLSVQRPGDTRASLIINGIRTAIKFSTRWTDGKYKFQQIRENGYDYVICLGISPFEAHCWIFERQYAIKNATPQHKGRKGAEYWIQIDPENPDKWAQNHGGTLENAYLVLRSYLENHKG